MLKRHDLVYLDLTSVHKLNVVAEYGPFLEGWLAKGRPLVVGRQIDGDSQLRLGITIPGTGPRCRVSVMANPESVLRSCSPPLISELLTASPHKWHPLIKRLIKSFAQIGIEPRGFGSLVNQFFSGENCLNDNSDLDVLIDCENRSSAELALAILKKNSVCIPKIDGELRMRQNWAVSWRELAQVPCMGNQVLVKSNQMVQLLSANEFLDGNSRTENHDANPNLNKALAA